MSRPELAFVSEVRLHTCIFNDVPCLPMYVSFVAAELRKL